MFESFELSNSLYIGCAICSFLASFVLWKNAGDYFRLANKLLAAFFFFTGYCVSSYLLLLTGWMKAVPFLYKTAAPINFLILPSIYLYLRVVIFNLPALQKKDWWHFLPFLLSFIDLVPFYSIPLAEKRQIVAEAIDNLSNNYLNHNGIFPFWIQYLARVLQSFIYLLAIWHLLLFNKIARELLFKPSAYYSHIKEVKGWLLTVSSWMTISFCGFVALVFFVATNPEYAINGQSVVISSFILSFSTFALCIHIFLHPLVLYGLPNIITPSTNNDQLFKMIDDKPVKSKVDKRQLESDWNAIESVILLNKWYLKKGIAIEELANELKIPSRDLSFLINFHKNERYQDYINRLRIQHVTDQLKNKTTDTMTIEAIGNEAGFGSRSTFFAVFKKHMGCTPKEYLKKLE